MEVPIALWVLAGFAVLAGLVLFVIIMRKRGEKRYGMFFFKSISFGLLILGATFLATITFLVHVFPKIDPVNDDIAKFTTLLSIVGALVLNIRRSNPPFGVAYTLAQAAAAYSFVLALLGLIVLKKVDD